MSTLQIESIPLWLRWLRAIVASLLPHAVRANYLTSFDQYRERPLLYQMQHAAQLVWGAYRVLVVPTLKDGSACTFAEVPLIAYCFLTAVRSTRWVPWWILLPLTAMLVGLSLRDIWWYHGKRGRVRAQLPPLEKYYLESSMDALCACLFMFLAQGLAWYFAWAVQVPNPVLFRACAIALPALALIRMLLRPMPDPKSPFEGKGMSAVEMYHATSRLNILWGACYCATIMMGMSDIPYYVPDVLRGGFEKPRQPRIAHVILDAGNGAEDAQRGPACLQRRHARFQVLIDEHVEVVLELDVELLLETLAAEERFQTNGEMADHACGLPFMPRGAACCGDLLLTLRQQIQSALATRPGRARRHRRAVPSCAFPPRAAFGHRG